MKLIVKLTGFSFCKIVRQSSFLFLGIFLVSGLLISCGPKKQYVGPYLPDEEIAIIKPDDKMFTPVKILSIDKISLNTGVAGIAVHPGEHTLLLEAALDYPFLDGYLYFKQDLTFNAEAGQVYTLYASILPMREEGFAWITSDREPDKFIVKKYATGLILLSSYP